VVSAAAFDQRPLERLLHQPSVPINMRLVTSLGLKVFTSEKADWPFYQAASS
jgi:hypothetical protein